MTSEQNLKEYENELDNYKNELLKSQEKLDQQSQSITQYAGQMYGGSGKQNLVEWELDFKPELEDISRSLRCDVLKIDDYGNQFWITNPKPERIFLNELGVNDVLRKVILLVNKNKVLSNYTIDEVKERVKMIGHEIRGLIYMNYEAYGIDNEYKMSNYPSIVMDVLDIVEGAYRRALSGSTHKGLNEQRLVVQNDALNNPNQQAVKQKAPVSFYNPATWGN